MSKQRIQKPASIASRYLDSEPAVVLQLDCFIYQLIYIILFPP